MSAQIVQELKARGVAQVIVILKATVEPLVIAAARGAPGARMKAALAPAEKAARALTGCFVTSEMSLPEAVSRSAGAVRLRSGAPRPSARHAAPARYFEHLGILLGTVTRDGLAALRRDPRVRAVTGAPPLSLIRPSRAAAL
jgi:hypothetical protein